MLLSRKSSHHQLNIVNKQNHQLNSKTLSVHAQQANYTRLVQQDMLNKLLRPPAKKQSKGQLRKYDPQFQKPDVEKLIHQNNLLKQQLMQNKKTIIDMKFKNKQLQKKVQKLQQNQNEQFQEAIEGKKRHPSVHTQILKKKIHQLHIKYISAENEIRNLKKLPSSSIYQENNIEKQHLLAETIRLKAMLATYQKQNMDIDNLDHYNGFSNSINGSKFHQQFLKILKQQNEKLKATIRLLENDKVLMKARQNNQNKLNNDLKKQIETIKAKLLSKQAELQKLTHENQNLLFKKAAKFRFDKQQKQNKLITELTKTIEQLRSEKKKMYDENQLLITDNLHLKDKQKNKNDELRDKNQELDKIKIEISEIKNQFEARIKSLQMNKIHSKDSGFGMKSSKGKFSDYQMYGFQQTQDFHKKNQMYREPITEAKNEFNWGKPIKFEQLDFSLLKIWALKQQKLIQKYQDILVRTKNGANKVYKQNTIRFQEAYYLFKSGILALNAQHSLKLVKYIYSDHSHFINTNNSEQPVIKYSLAATIIKAAINQFTQCLTNPTIINSWRCFLSKGKKFIKQLQQVPGQLLNKDQFIQILSKNKTSALQREEINFMLLNGFSLTHSINEIMINRKAILQCINLLMGDSKYISQMILKSDFTKMVSSKSNMQSMHPNISSSKNMSEFKNSRKKARIIDEGSKSINDQKRYKTQHFYNLKDIGLGQFQHQSDAQIENEAQSTSNYNNNTLQNGIDFQKVQSESDQQKQQSQINQQNELNLEQNQSSNFQSNARMNFQKQRQSKAQQHKPQNSIIFNEQFSSFLFGKKYQQEQGEQSEMLNQSLQSNI